MELLRCRDCRRMWLEMDILKKGSCRCGCRMVTQTNPSNFLEEMIVWYWEVKLWLRGYRNEPDHR